MVDNQSIPNVMPDALVEPITDMELILAKLTHDGEMNQKSVESLSSNKNHHNEV